MVSLKSITILFSGIILLFGAGVYFGWSWRWNGFLWFDIALHFLGGALTGMIFLYLNHRYQLLNSMTQLPNYLITVITLFSFVALVGVLWEFAEYAWYVSAQSALDQKPPGLRVQASWYPDTLDDLLNNLLGGLTTFLSVQLLQRKKEKPTLAD